MTVKEKATLVKQAGKLYTLGVTVERCREKLRRLVEKGVAYNSLQMKAALTEFETADSEWKRVEKEHLKFIEQLGIENKSNQSWCEK